MSGAHGFLLFLATLSVYNCGVIWPTQSVTYPLFRRVPEDAFLAYHLFYNRRITASVIIPGFLSFLAPFALLFFRPPSVTLWMAILSAAFGGLALFVSVALEIPRHIQLQRQGKSDAVIQGLIVNNWLRTFAITAQTILSLWFLSRTFVPSG